MKEVVAAVSRLDEEQREMHQLQVEEERHLVQQEALDVLVAHVDGAVGLSPADLRASRGPHWIVLHADDMPDFLRAALPERSEGDNE